MKKIFVISTCLRRGSISDMLAEWFMGGLRAGYDVEMFSFVGKYILFCWGGALFCGGVNDACDMEGNPKLQEAYELGKSIF